MSQPRSCGAILEEIEGAFGFVPPMFQPIADNALQLENLWHQTLHSYAMNPLPAMFKEKLAAYLSRFCEVPYCIVCHSCALHSLGVGGKAILQLLEVPPPTRKDLETQLRELSALQGKLETFPDPDTLQESLVIGSTALIFLDEDDGRIRGELRRLLDHSDFQNLLAFVAFVKTVHQWMQSHPEVAYESDMRAQKFLASALEQEPTLAEFFATYATKVREEREIRSGRRRDAERLLESEERFRSLIEATNQIVWRADVSGRMEEISGWAEFSGMSSETLSQGGWSPALHPEDRESLEERWRRGLGGGQKFEIEYRLRRSDGYYAYFLTHAVPLRRGDGKVREWIGASANIDARKRAEQRLAEAYEKEHRIADALQQSLLILPRNIPGMDFHAFYEAARNEASIGGDFLDVYELGNDRVALFVGDVSGKGLEAAALTAEVKFTLRAYLREDPQPGPTLSRLNRFLMETRHSSLWQSSTFVCIALAVMNTATGEVEFALAGAEPPMLIVPGGDTRLVAESDVPLGVLPNVEYLTSRFPMAQDELLILATDGLTEARGDDRMFGQDGIQQTIQSLPRDASLETTGKTLLGASRELAGGLLRDDVCLMLVRRRGE